MMKLLMPSILADAGNAGKINTGQQNSQRIEYKIRHRLIFIALSHCFYAHSFWRVIA